jgi:pimeloyl-ACP methyl ester carboxylesterase
MSLPPALPGEQLDLQGVHVYVAGQGPPMLLVHSVNAAAAAAEVRPVYEHAQATHTVFALDLPGYGLSDRSDRPYTPRLMTDALHTVAEHIRQRCGPVPIDALAVSLGCEFLARAATEQPAHWGRLALVSPTGLRGTKTRRAAPGSVIGPPWVLKLLRGPGWGAPLFRGLTRPDVIAYFLRRTWGSKDIDLDLWRYDVLTTRVPGAEHAPLHFLAARLFSADITTVYESLTQPVWMSHGTRGDFTDYRGMAVLKPARPWRRSVFQTGALPYFEVPEAFNCAWDAFLADATAPLSPA